jgi:hypothetical protein
LARAPHDRVGRARSGRLWSQDRRGGRQRSSSTPPASSPLSCVRSVRGPLGSGPPEDDVRTAAYPRRAGGSHDASSRRSAAGMAGRRSVPWRPRGAGRRATRRSQRARSGVARRGSPGLRVHQPPLGRELDQVRVVGVEALQERDCVPVAACRRSRWRRACSSLLPDSDPSRRVARGHTCHDSRPRASCRSLAEELPVAGAPYHDSSSRQMSSHTPARDLFSIGRPASVRINRSTVQTA